MKYYEIINKLIKEDKISFKEACEMIESVVSELLTPMIKDEVQKQLSNQNGFYEIMKQIWQDKETPLRTNIPGNPITSPYVGDCINTYPSIIYNSPNTYNTINDIKGKLIDNTPLTASANNITIDGNSNDFSNMTVNGNNITWNKDKQLNS